VETIWRVSGVFRGDADMEVRFQLDDDYIEDLREKLNLTAAAIAREGITLLNWAIREREQGRVILSADPDGKNVVRLAMPVLEQIRRTAPVAAHER